MPENASNSLEPKKAVPGRVVPKIETKDHALVIEGTEADQAALDLVMGAGSKDFVCYAMLQLVNLIKSKSPDQDLTMQTNAALAFIRAVDPQNELESALAAQMFATHHLSMDIMQRAARAEGLSQYEAHGNLATRLQRTFLAQLEGLGKHRRGGKQYVVHQHVNVQEGGRAVVANTVNSGVANG